MALCFDTKLFRDYKQQLIRIGKKINKEHMNSGEECSSTPAQDDRFPKKIMLAGAV